MNKLGIHALVWVSDWTDESIRYAVNKSAEVGYDLIEAVIFDPSEARPEQTARALAAAGISCVTGMALNPGADISSLDQDIARRGEQFITDAILATRDMGSELLGGVTHSAMHRYPDAAHPAVRDRLVEIYGRLADRAQAAGVRLGIEAVNRYESNVVNTLDDAAQTIAEVGSEALFIHMDTYHMNIEEHDCGDARGREQPRNLNAVGVLQDEQGHAAKERKRDDLLGVADAADRHPVVGRGVRGPPRGRAGHPAPPR